MKNYHILLATIATLFTFLVSHAQNVGIGTSSPNAAAQLEVSAADKGILIPRVNLTATNSNAPVGSWVQGLLVYNLVNAGIAPNNVVANQFYYSNGSQWVAVGSGAVATGWSLTGNAGTTDGQNFIGTTDAAPLTFRVKNAQAGRIDSALRNTFFGYLAGNANTSGFENTASGVNALRSNTTGGSNTASGVNALFSNTTGSFNTASGRSALSSNTTGNSNTASGLGALFTNTIGNDNTASGARALALNTSGVSNTASGVSSLFSNTTGSNNTASGVDALRSNTTGGSNTASGVSALFSNRTGGGNTASGRSALFSNTTGGTNTASGVSALFSNTTGNDNTASGASALFSNTTGINNTASGTSALVNNTTGNDNTASGVDALIFNTIGNSNTAIGVGAGQGSFGIEFNQCTFIGANSSPLVARTNVTMLGYGIGNAQCTGDNQILLGNTAITQIRAQVSSLTTYSDARFKVNVQDNIKGLDFIMRLHPVSYQQDPAKLQQIWNPTGYMQASNPDYSEIRKKRFVGFLAQDVEKAAIAAGFDFPGIDVPQTDTEVYTLRYVDFIMPMVKAMQEQQGMIQAQQQENEAQKQAIEELKRQHTELKKQNEVLKQQNAQFHADMQLIKARLNL